LEERKNIRVIVVDDSPKDLNGLCFYLQKQAGLEIVGTAQNGFELLRIAEALKPDLVITDLHMPRLSGIECTLRLRQMMPQTRFIVFTDLDAPFTESDCTEPGADFYVYKEHMPGRVLTAIYRLFPELERRKYGASRDINPTEPCPGTC
jgi:DNA-binding NarL/FixJ family response regulator